MKQVNVESLEKMFQSVTSAHLIRNALKMYIPSKKYGKRIIVENIICFIPAFLMGVSLNTQEIFLEGIEIINDTIVAIFGIVFTGYALFQAFINNELLIRMINNEGKENKNKLQETNETFAELMMLCVISIMCNVLLKLIINSLSADFIIFDSKLYNDVMAITLVQLYFVFNANIFLELKSFIFNIFQLFNLHAGTKVIQIITEDGEKGK